MRRFDYSFLSNGLLPANLINLTANISALKTMAGVRKFPLYSPVPGRQRQDVPSALIAVALQERL